MSVDRLYFSDCANSTITMKMFLLTGDPLTLTLSTPPKLLAGNSKTNPDPNPIN